MNIGIIIAIVVLLFFVVTGSYYFFKAMAGPRRLDELEKIIKEGRCRTAIPELEKILERDERNMRARFMLARCYADSEDHQRAILHCRQLTKTGQYTHNVSETQVRKILANSLLHVNNLTEAKNEYLLLTTLEPDHFYNFYKAGEIFFKSGVYNKALKFLYRASQINTRHPETLSLLGQCYYREQNYPVAREALVKAVEIKSDLYPAHYYLGMTLRYMGDLEWAIKEFTQSERSEELRPKALLAKGMTLIDQQNYSSAIIELEKALKVAPPRSEIMLQINYFMAMAYEKSRDLPDAIKSWEAIEAMKPGYRDVRSKLDQYKEFRTDDAIKDFLIAGNAQFEGIVRKLIESLGYSVAELKIESDTIIRAMASETDSRSKAARRQYCAFRFQRDVSPVKEDTVRAMHEMMRTNHAQRAFIYTAGEFTPSAVEFAASRPIELVDGRQMAEHLRKAMT
ncbi:MAG: tetratricopeptide repeat protein [Leptospiraceae bacterium]|nr:tetratricopeptide repeat protein [Leptospiraceae bacterium]